MTDGRKENDWENLWLVGLESGFSFVLCSSDSRDCQPTRGKVRGLPNSFIFKKEKCFKKRRLKRKIFDVILNSLRHWTLRSSASGSRDLLSWVVPCQHKQKNFRWFMLNVKNKTNVLGNYHVSTHLIRLLDVVRQVVVDVTAWSSTPWLLAHVFRVKIDWKIIALVKCAAPQTDSRTGWRLANRWKLTCLFLFINAKAIAKIFFQPIQSALLIFFSFLFSVFSYSLRDMNEDGRFTTAKLIVSRK